MQLVLPAINLIKNEELITLLEYLGSVQSDYPPPLLADRRATFIAHVDQLEKARSAHQLHSKN